MKLSLATFVILTGGGSLLRGQATPTATVAEPRFNPGPSLPMIDGSFQYSLTASELIQSGLNSRSGVTATTNLSGNVEYISPSTVHPTTLLYSGGLLLNSYAGQGTQTYQSLTVSQGLVGHGWAIGAADTVSFLPQSPTTGLVGIPGVGDLGLQPLPDPTAPAQTVLTNYGKRVSNTATGTIERQINSRTSVSGSVNYGILRFIGDTSSGSNSLDSSQLSGQVGINRVLNRRSSIGLSAQYSTFSYVSNPTSFTTRGLSLQYSRQLSKSLSFQASAGPQWVNRFTAISLFGSPTAIQVPAMLTVQVSSSLSYVRKTATFGLSYSRGANSGSGVQTGAVSDTVGLSAQRAFGRNWTSSLMAGYTRTSGLAINGTASSFYAGTQVSRRLTNSLSAFGGYTAIHQSIDSSLAARNAFSGFSQVFSIGITFSPRQSRLGQF